MIRLDTTTRKLQILLDSAITTNQLQVVVSYSDKTSSAYNGATQTGNTNSTTAVDICAAPASGTVRDVDFISVQNRDTVAATATIMMYDNGSTYNLITKRLGVGEQLVYTHGSGWNVNSATSPQGIVNSVQINDNGLFGGLANVLGDNGDIMIAPNSAPVTPSGNYVKLFCRNIANRMLPAAVGPSAMDYALQPSLWRQKCAIWSAPGNSTTVPGVFGINAYTALGTATARSVATTNRMSRTRRLGYVSAATAGSFAGLYNTAAQFTLGIGGGIGGFFFSTRFANTDAAACSGARSFCGMTSSVATATNVEPNTLTNAIGLAQLSTDATQLYITYGGSTAQTAIALGTNFPPMESTGATGGTMYDFSLFSPPNQNGVCYYSLERVGTSYAVYGTLGPGTTTTLPLNTLLSPRIWRCNNAQALAVAVDIMNIYLETDY